MGSGIGRYGFPAFGSVGLCTAVAYLGSQRRTKVRKNIDSVLPCLPFWVVVVLPNQCKQGLFPSFVNALGTGGEKGW